MKILNFKFVNYQRGQLLIQILILSAVAVVLMTGIMNWAKVNIQASRQASERERAIQFAEAGVEYYRWHLAHNQIDYKDGTGVAGPYVHTVIDKEGDTVGQFSLQITPPPTGSTKVIIESTGRPASSTVERIIRVEMAIPSLAKYATVANDFMRFGQGTEVFGPIHVNQGLRFDGLAHNAVTAAVQSMDDPDHTGNNEFGVHTHVNAPPGSGVNDTFRSNEAPPTTPVPTRADIFEAGRQFPVPAVDFVGLTSDLSTIKANAQASGRYFAASGSQGYQIILKTNDTFDLYTVTSQINPQSGCSSTQTGWGTWSINNKTLVGNYAIPANGLIFIEDNVWVEGTINTARATIANGRFPDNPSNRPQFTVNNDLKYTNYNGSDVIALIAQGNFNVGLVSENDLIIDAAIVSQNGRVGRYYYNSSCGSNYVRSTITLYGMIATYQRYGFAYTDSTGYGTRNINYDANLLYGPPPSFPLTSDQYEILSWKEI
ncbi:MAG TPA: hypothetical protein VJH67_03115 [Candidatus Paceibacterota bacterium]